MTASRVHGRGLCRSARRGSSSGTQLLEFALVLPLLVVFAVAIFDFGAAFNLKQKLNNAAREGARLAASERRDDLTNPATSGNPPSVQAVRQIVGDYLYNNRITTCRFDNINPAPDISAGNFTYIWTVSGGSCPGTATLTIRRNVAGPVVNGINTLLSDVRIEVPHGWSFGKIVFLIGAPGASVVSIASDAAMQNQF